MSPSRIVAVRGTLDVFGLAIVFLVAGMLHMALPSQGTPDVTRTVRDGVGLNSSYYQIPGRKSGTPNVFIPLRGVPTLDRPLGQVGAFYEPRMSGVFGFVDLAQHNGLGYDLEYFLVGRGDGMFLIEATPPINGPAVPEWQQLVPATTANLRGDFIQSPHGNHPTFPVHPYPAAPFVLNVPHPTNIPGYTPWSECVVLGDGAGNWVAYGSSGHHPGLHVVPLVRQGSQLRFGTGVHWNPIVNLNGVNRPRVPNVHNMTADPGSGLIFLCTNHFTEGDPPVFLPGHQTFFALSTRQNHGGSLTNPVVIKDYYGPQNQQTHAHPHDVFIKDGKVLVSLSSEIFPIPGTTGSTGSVDEYALSGFFGSSFPSAFAKRYLSPRIKENTTSNLLNPLLNPHGIASVHSCYKHGATLWLLAESIGHQMGFAAPGLASATNLDAAVGRPNICAVNLNQDAIGVGINASAYQPAMSVGIPFDTPAGQAARFAWENQQLNLGGLVDLLTQAQAVTLNSSQFPFVTYRTLRSGAQPPSNPYSMNPSREMFGIVHHIKGEFATAFMPHYTDGIDLVDLSDPVLGPVILGSSDTSGSQITDGYDDIILVLTGGVLQPMPAIEAGRINAIHAFHGAYNVWPHHDSGLICIASGVEGAIVMRVDEGWFNRYWLPTSFTMSGSSPVSLDYPHPKIVAENGPPRHGRPFTLRDANRHLLKRVDASGTSVAYRYTLLVGQAAPGVRPTALTNGYYQNIVPVESYGPQFDDVFHFPVSRFHTPSERIFMQMLVEEGAHLGGGDDADFQPRNPPVISASRGTWIGVASH